MLTVAAAVLRRGDQVLVARRASGQRHAGRWEFPGGKLESAETPEQCLVRELREEMNAEIEVGSYIARAVHDYGRGPIEVLAFEAKLLSKELQLTVHDEVRWCRVEELSGVDLVDADIAIVNALKAHA